MAERDRCGDVALCFGDRSPEHTRGPSPWSAWREGPGWRLWVTEPHPGWRGHDLTVEEAPGTLRLVLGHRPDHWLELTHDDGADTWTVRTDRFGTVHTYVGDGMVTTFSPAAFASGASLDWAAIAGFVRLGWYPGDRLPVEGVRLVRPGTSETWPRSGGAPRATRWAGWEVEVRPRPLDAAVDDLAAALDEVLDDQAATGRIGLPISGGLDSRVTVASLTRPGAPAHDLWAYSYGYDADSPELRIAAEVASARGLRLTPRVIGPYLAHDLDAVLAATEGLVDLTLCRQSAMAGDLAEHTDAVIGAHWGDVWFGAPTAPAGGDGAGALLAASTKRGHEWLTRHLVAPHLDGDPEAAVADLLADEAAAVAHLPDPEVRQLALKTEQWSLRWTEATLRAFQAASPPRLLFYDPRLADLALSLPAELRRDRRLQVEYLRRRAPDLARVEWQAVETDLFRLRHERTWRLPRRALRRVARRLRPPTARLRNWEVQLLEPAGRALVDRHLLEPGATLFDLVDRAAVADLVGRHRAAPADPGLGYAVSTLLTFAAWQERWA